MRKGDQFEHLKFPDRDAAAGSYDVRNLKAEKQPMSGAEPSRGAPDEGAKVTTGIGNEFDPGDPPEIHAEPSEPWQVVVNGSRKYGVHFCGALAIETAAHDRIAMLMPHETEERARLIAQAPTLLAENEKLRAGHVVLIEALRACTAAIKFTNLGLVGKEAGIKLYDAELLAEAAIKQAERT